MRHVKKKKKTESIDQKPSRNRPSDDSDIRTNRYIKITMFKKIEENMEDFSRDL